MKLQHTIQVFILFHLPTLRLVGDVTMAHYESSNYFFPDRITWLQKRFGSIVPPQQEQDVDVHCCSNIWFNNELYKINLDENLEYNEKNLETLKMNGANIWRNENNKDKVSRQKTKVK